MRATVAAIAAEQSADGAIPWFRGGRLDAWDMVEAAIALDVGGEHDRARACSPPRSRAIAASTMSHGSSCPPRNQGSAPSVSCSAPIAATVARTCSPLSTPGSSGSSVAAPDRSARGSGPLLRGGSTDG